jgi:hypothetical protein
VSFIARRDFRVGSDPLSITMGDFNGDGRQDLAAANSRAGSVSILVNNIPGGVVNDFVIFEPLPSTFTLNPDPTGCPADFVGVFRFAARLTNISARAPSDLMVTATTLSHGNLLQDADSSPGGIGARLIVPHADDFSYGVLSPAEWVDVPFVIWLQERTPFMFEVDVLGMMGSDVGTGAGASLLNQWRHVE